MLIISKGKASTKKWNTSKLSPTERLESLYEKNSKYSIDAGEVRMSEIAEESEEMYKEAKQAEGDLKNK